MNEPAVGNVAVNEAPDAIVPEFQTPVSDVDVCAIASMYPDWLGFGAGVTNYLAVPDLPLDEKGTRFDLPGGTITPGDVIAMREIKTYQAA